MTGCHSSRGRPRLGGEGRRSRRVWRDARKASGDRGLDDGGAAGAAAERHAVAPLVRDGGQARFI
ncbi:AraC family transcriptional regulator, partial [Burkholderia pseudomallei]